MIPVVSIQRILRDEGLNFGLPTTLLTLGGMVEGLQVEDLLESLLRETPKRGWVCVVGSRTDDPLRLGIGTLVRGLSQLQRFVEIETDGSYRDPSWMTTCDRWVVDCRDKMVFNLGSLRSTDTIRFKVDEITKAESVENYLVVCKSLPCTKYVRVPRGDSKLLEEITRIVSNFERTRLFVV